MTTVKNLNIEQKYLKQFSDLYMRLEPENLTCDGELSSSEWKRREKKLLKDWKRLEKKVGRTVSEEDVEKVIFPYIDEALSDSVMRGD